TAPTALARTVRLPSFISRTSITAPVRGSRPSGRRPGSVASCACRGSATGGSAGGTAPAPPRTSASSSGCSYTLPASSAKSSLGDRCDTTRLDRGMCLAILRGPFQQPKQPRSAPMIIGCPKEVKTREYRVGLVPGGVLALASRGHTVLIEKGAGAGSGIGDESYVKAGAQIVD